MTHDLVLHSVSYSGSWGQHFLSVEQFLDQAADLGFDGVMLMAKRPHLSVLDWPPAARVRLRSHAEKLGLRVACIAGYTNFTADLEHRDIPNREFQVRHVVELAEMARDLGCGLVRVFTGYEHPSATLDAQSKMVVESLRECSDRSAEFGVTIGVQNHHDIACDFESQYELIREVNAPNCRAMFDAWAPALQDVDLGSVRRKSRGIAPGLAPLPAIAAGERQPARFAGRRQPGDRPVAGSGRLLPGSRQEEPGFLRGRGFPEGRHGSADERRYRRRR